MVTPRHVSPDRDIEGLICKDHAREVCPHKPPDDGGIGGVSTDQEMGAKQEQIVYSSDGSRARQGPEIASFISIFVFADQDFIDFVRAKSLNFDWRTGDDQLLEFRFQFADVPDTLFAQAIDG